MSNRPYGTIQVDVDELAVYYESLSLPSPDGESGPVYAQGLPRLLELFEQFEIRATFFICGRDLESADRRRLIRRMAEQGHELANHSYSHPRGFARLPAKRLEEEILKSGERIAEAGGAPVRGFRAPAFSLSPAVLHFLERAGYLYDASILPTPWSPLMRWGHHRLSRCPLDESQYGHWRYGWAPLNPYHPDLDAPQRRGETRLWECPVTTMPGLRLPFHSTFVIGFGAWVFRLGFLLNSLRARGITYLLHPAELIDPVEDPCMASFRFLRVPWEDKRRLYESMLQRLSRAYRLVPTVEYLQHQAAGGT